nr:AbrB/MazE/SpoVT family DNA-binding domain-containing protein [Candidatus Woesearchaeota archaeon]
MKGMKCVCGKTAEYVKNLRFNNYKIDGWKCNSCEEIYYNPQKAERILLLNKLKKQVVKAKLGRIRSNLVLRLPRDIETALNLHKGEEVSLKVEGNEIKVVPSLR